jgi:hypothetical protein
MRFLSVLPRSSRKRPLLIGRKPTGKNESRGEVVGEGVETNLEAALVEASRNQTANRAARILASKGVGFVVPTAKQKRILLVEFARCNLVLYGKAFDILKLLRPVDLDDVEEVRKNLEAILICEIKSTSNALPEDFKGYFFALTAGEMLVAQSLKKRFRFVFVNTTTGSFLELSLPELLAKARGVYPTWSISF